MDRIGNTIMVIITVSIITLFGAGMYGCYEDAHDPIKIKERELQDIACKTPAIVGEVDGLKLYSVQPNGCSDLPENTVYFSTSGTQRRWTECHMVGKIRHCEDRQQIIPTN